MSESMFNHANEAIEIALLAMDYQDRHTSIAYAVRVVQIEQSITFAPIHIKYIQNHVTA